MLPESHEGGAADKRFRGAPARPEQPSQWPMLDLTEPMRRGSSAVRLPLRPYHSSSAPSSCPSPATVPVPWASMYEMADGSRPALVHTYNTSITQLRILCCKLKTSTVQLSRHDGW